MSSTYNLCMTKVDDRNFQRTRNSLCQFRFSSRACSRNQNHLSIIQVAITHFSNNRELWVYIRFIIFFTEPKFIRD